MCVCVCVCNDSSWAGCIACANHQSYITRPCFMWFYITVWKARDQFIFWGLRWIGAYVLYCRNPEGAVHTSSPLLEELVSDETYSQQCLCSAECVAPVGQVDRPFAQEVFCGCVLLFGRDKGPYPHTQEETCERPPVHKVSNAYCSILLPLNCNRKHAICRSNVFLFIEREHVSSVLAIFAQLSEFGHESNVSCLSTCIYLKLELRHRLFACIFQCEIS